MNEAVSQREPYYHIGDFITPIGYSHSESIPNNRRLWSIEYSLSSHLKHYVKVRSAMWCERVNEYIYSVCDGCWYCESEVMSKEEYQDRKCAPKATFNTEFLGDLL